MSSPTDGTNRERRSDSKGPSVISYGSAAAYANELRKWMVISQCMGICHEIAVCQTLAQFFAISAAPNVNQPTIPVTLPTGATVAHSASRADRQYIERRKLSSFTRRIMAEAIDSMFAFAVKLFIIYMLVEVGSVDLDKYDRLLGDEADLQTLIDITQELFPVEMLAKMIISVMEAFFISYGLGAIPHGCTPGKALLGIQVITCYQVTLVAGTEEVNVQRTTSVPFKNSLARSLMKNMLINLLFPLSAAAYTFTFNRALYDVTAKTIVVYM